MTTATTDLIRLSAVDAVAALKSGEASPLDLVDAALKRIEATNGQVNSVVTLCPERARSQARRMQEGPASEARDEPGWLAGLPVLIKDLADVAGVRTTYGSRVYAEHVPTRSDIVVETLEGRGAVIIGKTNTPEFGNGSVTFNDIFGTTVNPWDTTKTSGGSSGGSAAAVATGQAWLASGSDFGGSLRIPASFCSVVGLRPGPGVVAHGPAGLPFDPFFVDGPIARTVCDAALMLDAMSGHHPLDPLSFPAPVKSYAEAAREADAPRRIAYTNDLGEARVDREVAEICAGAARRFEDAGAVVEPATPDMSDATDMYRVLRNALYVNLMSPLLEHRDLLKPELAWNIEAGLPLTASEIGKAERARGAMCRRVGEFFMSYDLLVCPTVAAPPFSANLRYLEELDGHRFETYYDWMFLTFAISITGCPCLSLPCGFTSEGLPVGLQIVAPWRQEGRLLSAAAALESILQVCGEVPLDPR